MRLSFLLPAVLVTACAAPPVVTEADAPVSSGTRFVHDSDLRPDTLPVTRQGRYTLAELTPETAQRDLMRQLVEIAIPPRFEASVGDALRHALRRSGYRLCESDSIALLTGLPLPAAHLRLGPLTLREALRTLAGPSWELGVDESTREVCFRRAGATVSERPVSESSDTCGVQP